MRPSTHKYGAKPTEIDGITFHSQGEARRYQELKLLERAGEISQLELQPKYPLAVNGVKICTYKADFKYIENGQVVVEDFKGVRTTVYKLKKALMKAIYTIDLKET